MEFIHANYTRLSEVNVFTILSVIIALGCGIITTAFLSVKLNNADQLREAVRNVLSFANGIERNVQAIPPLIVREINRLNVQRFASPPDQIIRHSSLAYAVLPSTLNTSD